LLLGSACIGLGLSIYGFWQGIGVRIRSGYGTGVLGIEVGWWGIGGKDRIDMVGIWSVVGR